MALPLSGAISLALPNRFWWSRGKAIVLNGHTVTWSDGNTTSQVFGVVA